MSIAKISLRFEEIYEEQPALIVRSPGRVNLLGEHIDYNNGFVLPAAIDKMVCFAVSLRNDEQINLFAFDLNEKYETTLSLLAHSDVQWANYLLGAISEIQKVVSLKQGINIVFGSDIPIGAGMSSSAALECGLIFALNQLMDWQLTRLEMVKMGQKAENNFVGLQCGIMDQFASMMGQKNKVIKLDCNTLDYSYFPFDTDDYLFVLCDTQVKHALGDSEYNTRRQECEEALRILKSDDPSVKTMRDVTFSALLNASDKMPKVVFKRAKYVVEEIERVTKACKYLQNNDFEALGQLMYDTHNGLQNGYEVSCAELDFLVEQTQNDAAVLGARMMGAGFGGCTINLVKKSEYTYFIERMKIAYMEKYGIELPCYEVVLSNGTEVIEVVVDELMAR